MSSQALTLVAAIKKSVGQLAGICATKKAILVSMANYADEKFELYPSQSTIGDDAFISRQCVNKHIKELVEMGVLKKQQVKNEYGQRPNKYRIEIVRWLKTHGYRVVMNDDGYLVAELMNKAPKPSDVGVSSGTTPSNVGVSSRMTGGVIEDDRGCQRGRHDPVNDPVNEPKEKRSFSASAKKTKTRTPDVFPVTDEMFNWASTKGLTVDLLAETEQFLDYHRGKGSTQVDWLATWRTWMRNAQKWQKPKARSCNQAVLDQMSAQEQAALIDQMFSGVNSRRLSSD